MIHDPTNSLSIACSEEFSSDKTQLFTIVSIVYLGFLWRLLSHPTAQHIPGIFNFLWVVTDAQLDYCVRVGHKYGGA